MILNHSNTTHGAPSVPLLVSVPSTFTIVFDHCAPPASSVNGRYLVHTHQHTPSASADSKELLICWEGAGSSRRQRDDCERSSVGFAATVLKPAEGTWQLHARLNGVCFLCVYRWVGFFFFFFYTGMRHPSEGETVAFWRSSERVPLRINASFLPWWMSPVEERRNALLFLLANGFI